MPYKFSLMKLLSIILCSSILSRTSFASTYQFSFNVEGEQIRRQINNVVTQLQHEFPQKIDIFSAIKSAKSLDRKRILAISGNMKYLMQKI